MDLWREITEFPGYSVSDAGDVRNDDTGRMLSRFVNQSGVVNVSLMKLRKQYKKGVALLVANSFLPESLGEAFDTPINLNGDRLDNHAYNLELRPRWFAVKYFRQFRSAVIFNRPIEDVDTKEYFDSSWDAAIKYGLLERDILVAAMNNTDVWPTRHRFRMVD